MSLHENMLTLHSESSELLASNYEGNKKLSSPLKWIHPQFPSTIMPS